MLWWWNQTWHISIKCVHLCFRTGAPTRRSPVTGSTGCLKTTVAYVVIFGICCFYPSYVLQSRLLSATPLSILFLYTYKTRRNSLISFRNSISGNILRVEYLSSSSVRGLAARIVDICLLIILLLFTLTLGKQKYCISRQCCFNSKRTACDSSSRLSATGNANNFLYK